MNNNDFTSNTFTWALDTTTPNKPQEELFGLSDADLFQFLLGEEAQQAALSDTSNDMQVDDIPQTKSVKKEIKAAPVTTSTTSRLDFRPINDFIPESQLKAMTSKERRQLRNKISARNFRNRRKEYVGTLEEQLNDSKNESSQLKLELKWAKAKIEKLETENDKLRLDLMLSGIVLPTTTATATATTTTNIQEMSPYSSSLIHSSLNFSSSSSDESNLSSPPNLFTDFPDNWDFVLPQQTTQDSYIASAVVPDWNIDTVLSKETSLMHPSQNQLLLKQYPLLAPALMSIVVAHTMTMSTDELLATAKLNPSVLPAQIEYSQKPLPGVMSDKEAKAVWSLLEPLTLLNERNEKVADKAVVAAVDGKTECDDQCIQQQPDASDCRNKICEFYESNVASYCVITWFQQRVCRYVCEYIASNCPANKPSTEAPKQKRLLCRSFERARRYITTSE
ncbi:hypothetical protein EDC94DRAFT_661750 [Helicostylum pulchrum]|uniref:BZIP domain-containing protein n=1 Tax=Helicostylum pulchrum TaxID=562976 RepID=A0ABP9Y327_9FUNG|nr:hypothetical protein EDC94DRAFT_661750 [Helicostylum pulchrum]